jgi:hypothetical protein
MRQGLTDRTLALFALKVAIQRAETDEDRGFLQEVLLLSALGAVDVGLSGGELVFTPGPALTSSAPSAGPLWN